jgi:hypothetical protein
VHQKGKVNSLLSISALPLLDIVHGPRGEGHLLGVRDEASDCLLVVGERGHGLARREVPELDGGVVAARNDLRIDGAADERTHCAIVTP